MQSSLSREDLLKEHAKLLDKYIQIYCKIWYSTEKEFFESLHEDGWDKIQTEMIDHIKDLNNVWRDKWRKERELRRAKLFRNGAPI